MVVWLDENPLEVGRTYLVKHTTRQTRIRALSICHRMNVTTLQQEQALELNMNDIAAVEFEAHVPLFFDPYASNRATGSFILIDAISNATVGAGMIETLMTGGETLEAGELAPLAMPRNRVSAQERYERHGHYPAVFLLDNRPALAARLEGALFDRGFEVLHLGARGTSSNALLEGLRAAHAIGAVFIYSGQALHAETKKQLASETTAQLFDLSHENENFNDEELFRRALAMADSLRLAIPKKESAKGALNGPRSHR
jgi:hypothetical protein